jgi:hypothetical protein
VIHIGASEVMSAPQGVASVDAHGRREPDRLTMAMGSKEPASVPAPTLPKKAAEPDRPSGALGGARGLHAT